MALIAQPTKGIITAMGKSKRKANDPLVKPRQDTSREAFERSTPGERRAILDAFEVAIMDTDMRKQRLKDKVAERLEKAAQAMEEVEKETAAAASKAESHAKTS